MISVIIALVLPMVLMPLLVLTRRQSVLPEAVSTSALIVAAVLLTSVPSGAYGSFQVDMLTRFFGITFLIVSLIAVVGTYGLEFNGEKPVYYSLILASTTGMILVGATNDMLGLIVSWELMTIPTYLLAGFLKHDTRSNEAAIKYFLAGAISSAMILYGFSLVYGLTGETRLNEIFVKMSRMAFALQPLALISGLLILSGFAVKMAMAPFHLWLPDTLTGAPPTASAIIAGGTKSAGFAAAIRVLILVYLTSRVYYLSSSWPLLLAIMATITMTWGNLAALTQRNLARMLAFSSIGHAGYMLVGLAVQGTQGALLGATGLLLHVLFHGVMKSSAFAGVRIFGYSYDELSGFGRRAPLPSALMALILFSLAGMPPFAGFWGKLYLFLAAIQAGMAWLALVGFLNSALSLGYYGYLVKIMFMDEEDGRTREPRIGRGPLIALIIGGVFMIIAGLYPTPVINAAIAAAKTFI